MGTLKQWLGWTVFLGVVPAIALLLLARRLAHHEIRFYVAGVLPLLLYFYVLGRLGLDVPGKMEEPTPESAVTFLGIPIRRSRLLGKAVAWLQTFVAALAMPVSGAALILSAVRDGETVGYLLGPAMIWVSGGLWVLYVRFQRERRTARLS